MGRRSHRDPDLKSAIGDHYVDEAIAGLTRTAAETVAVMTEYPHTREHTLPMLFDADVLERAERARGIIVPNSEVEAYPIMPSVNLCINFKGAKVPTISPTAFRLQPIAGPLLSYAQQVKAIHEQFSEVKAVLKWLNRNATIGAIRYYWPSVLQLCPNSPALKDMQHVPTRYTVPQGISLWTQSLKDAAATVAGSLLLPAEAKARTKNTMWLTFPQYTVERGGIEFETDTTYYFI